MQVTIAKRILTLVPTELDTKPYKSVHGCHVTDLLGTIIIMILYRVYVQDWHYRVVHCIVLAFMGIIILSPYQGIILYQCNVSLLLHYNII